MCLPSCCGKLVAVAGSKQRGCCYSCWPFKAAARHEFKQLKSLRLLHINDAFPFSPAQAKIHDLILILTSELLKTLTSTVQYFSSLALPPRPLCVALRPPPPCY